MGRDRRAFDAHEIYHLTAHAVDDRLLFMDDVDYQDFVIRLGRIVTAERWLIYAACLMGTHHHLVLQPTAGSVSDGMELLHGGFARAYNRRHGRRGVLFESRFHSARIEDEAHLFEVIRYVARNPVAAGLVERPQDWPWSTYGQLVGTQRRWPFFDPLRVIDVFGSVAGLREYVETARASDVQRVSGTVGA